MLKDEEKKDMGAHSKLEPSKCDGSIQVKKWKPLAFDQVTENPEATVADILGELTTVASLHVRLYSVPDNPQEWRDITVRNAVLELLREMSQSKLAKLCPLSQPMLSNIINNRYMGKIGKEKCQEFGQWYLTYRKQHPEGGTPEVVPTERPLDGRLTFHPLKELPMMRDWFHGCRNPSKRTLQMYVDILNQGPVRQQERPKVVLSTLKNWWKNEKQRERKNLRSDDPSPDKESSRPKRKRRSCSNPDNPREDSSLHNFSGSSSQEAPRPNNFTMIHHDPAKKEDPFTMIHHDADKKQGQFTMIHHDADKKEGQFTMIHHDADKKEGQFTMIHHDPDKKEDFAMIHHGEDKKEDMHFDHPFEVKDKISPFFGGHHFAPDSKSNGGKITLFSHIHPDGSIERFLRKEEPNGKEDLFQKVGVDSHAPLFGFPVGVAKSCCPADDGRVSSEDDVDVGI
ncbi:uncharacterized protein LOC129232822 [Uloborus diversus]|uniref:uncharacterized protein LOC129232822 n=1 Tax=Uloborus diversus TaxID=327109 RepID=UPI00240A6A1B|nr:uncharacterized protein LOC129232822 [Uloborus diversus]